MLCNSSCCTIHSSIEVIMCIEELIVNKNILDVAVKDVQSLSHEDYALVRKDYFGASDSSILCGVNLYKTLDQLIIEKNNKFITDEEKAVGEKPIVKKGYDLERVTRRVKKKFPDANEKSISLWFRAAKREYKKNGIEIGVQE